MKNVRLIMCCLGLCCLSYCVFVGPFFGIRYTISQSLPYKLFLSRPFSHVVKNQYVTLEHAKSPILIAKQVIGIAGDLVSSQAGRLFINHIDYGPILEISPSGLTLKPLAEGYIPEEYVFVYAPHVKSFDSRYDDFGLVKIENLREVLWPIF